MRGEPGGPEDEASALERAVLEDCTLGHAQRQSTSLRSASRCSTSPFDANFSDADFSQTVLHRVRFTEKPPQCKIPRRFGAVT
jgi:uncharacterized protein YjbI with pentapeptide repeats